jgi:hypothetical protein
MNPILFETCAFPCNYKVFHKGLSISTKNDLVLPSSFAMCQSTLVETFFNSMWKLHSGTSTDEREHPLHIVRLQYDYSLPTVCGLLLLATMGFVVPDHLQVVL